MKRSFVFFAFLLLLTGVWGVGYPFVARQPARAQTPIPQADGLLTWPISGSIIPDTDSVSSPFGPRWQASQGRYDYHSGIDIAAPMNTPVHVAADGVVYSVGWPTLDSGLTVVVYHPALNYYSAYLHLNSASVVVDQAVTQGEVIGQVGNSGTTEFMHLHFEIRLAADDYPASTRNPMGYLPRPEVSAPSIHISALQSSPIYSPTVTLAITTTRQEIDLNQVRVILQDRATGTVLNDQMVDFNLRIHTGSDSLDQDGIQLVPSHYTTSTLEYELTANFYNLHGSDAFTLTVRATDLFGNTSTVVAAADDTMPPGRVTSLEARWRADGRVDLAWIAPGDNGQVGVAATYDIRYAHEPINSFIWDFNAVALPNPPAPLPGGQRQTWSAPGPFSDPLYFALRATDAEGNRSFISNSAQVQANIFLPMVIR